MFYILYTFIICSEWMLMGFIDQLIGTPVPHYDTSEHSRFRNVAVRDQQCFTYGFSEMGTPNSKPLSSFPFEVRQFWVNPMFIHAEPNLCNRIVLILTSSDWYLQLTFGPTVLPTHQVLQIRVEAEELVLLIPGHHHGDLTTNNHHCKGLFTHQLSWTVRRERRWGW